MKKLAIVLGILGISGVVYAATVNQPMPSAISVLTPAQVLYSTPTYAGQVIVCNACTSGSTSNTYSLCIATESTTAQNGYIIVSTQAAINVSCK